MAVTLFSLLLPSALIPHISIRSRYTKSSLAIGDVGIQCTETHPMNSNFSCIEFSIMTFYLDLNIRIFPAIPIPYHHRPSPSLARLIFYTLPHGYRMLGPGMRPYCESPHRWMCALSSPTLPSCTLPTYSHAC